MRKKTTWTYKSKDVEQALYRKTWGKCRRRKKPKLEGRKEGGKLTGQLSYTKEPEESRVE